MDPYLALRQQAAAKRDEAIALARKVYRQDIEAIQKLQRSVPSEARMAREPKSGRNTMEILRSLIPPDKSFTLTDALHWLHGATGKHHRDATIRCYLWKLSCRGVVRKLYKTGHNEHLWIACESNVNGGPIDTMSLPQIVELILDEEEKPLKTIEIAVAMQSRGYRQQNSPNTLMRAIRDMFKRYPGRFVQGEGGRWEVAG